MIKKTVKEEEAKFGFQHTPIKSLAVSWGLDIDKVTTKPLKYSGNVFGAYLSKVVCVLLIVWTILKGEERGELGLALCTEGI